jgi:hypothetical protein
MGKLSCWILERYEPGGVNGRLRFVDGLSDGD